MTDMRTDFELMLIEHLDFDVPCEVVFDGGNRQCEHGAVWAVTARPHCTKKPPHTAFICVEHFDHLMSDGVWSCTACDEDVRYRDRIIRTERIKP